MDQIIYLTNNINQNSLNYILNISQNFGFKISYNTPQQDFFLCWENDCIILKNNTNKIFVNFNSNYLQYRIKKLHNEKFNKIFNKDSNLICDATAGMGTDAFIIACLNFKLHLFERNPFIAILLADGINRAKLNKNLHKYIANMDLKFCSFDEYYPSNNLKPDIIYLDPMFTKNKNNALSNKQMNFFKSVVGQDNDCQKIVNNALKIATKKIIIKRPIKADFIINKKPNHQYCGKTIRFDIYLPI